MPHLLDIQTAAFETLLVPDDVHGARQDVSLERVFRDLFPITDVNEKYKLEFLGYALGEAKYSVEECIERDMTYAAPLKAKLRLDTPTVTVTTPPWAPWSADDDDDDFVDDDAFLGPMAETIAVRRWMVLITFTMITAAVLLTALFVYAFLRSGTTAP